MHEESSSRLSAVALATMIIYTFVTDKIGRRYPMCGAETLCNILMFIIGGLYYAPASSSNGKVLVSVSISLSDSR